MELQAISNAKTATTFQAFTFGKKDVEEALNQLELSSKCSNILPDGLDTLLEQLRRYIAGGGDLSPFSTNRSLSILCCYGFGFPGTDTSHIALRCLCNLLLLSEQIRQLFVDEGYPQAAVRLLKNNDLDDEFLSARLLLLCTYGTNNLKIDVHTAADVTYSKLSRHAKLITNNSAEPPTSATMNACSEVLKLICNIAASYPNQASAFSVCLSPILQILRTLDIPSTPLQPPISSLINCLVFLVPKYPWDSSSAPVDEVHLNRLVDILDRATRVYSDEDLDRYGSPLVQALLLISRVVSTKLKAHLQVLVLPTDKDHERVIGTGDSISAKLLRSSTSISTGRLRLLIPSFLFELCENDEMQFVHSIGYGYASGLLPLLKTQKALGTSGDSKDYISGSTGRAGDTEQETEEETGHDLQYDSSATPAIGNMIEYAINPVTGQRRDMETPRDVPEMTMEEKEREAERLFVLFQRLQQNGVIKVEHPLAQAMREGRLE